MTTPIPNRQLPVMTPVPSRQQRTLTPSKPVTQVTRRGTAPGFGVSAGSSVIPKRQGNSVKPGPRVSGLNSPRPAHPINHGAAVSTVARTGVGGAAVRLVARQNRKSRPDLSGRSARIRRAATSRVLSTKIRVAPRKSLRSSRSTS